MCAGGAAGPAQPRPPRLPGAASAQPRGAEAAAVRATLHHLRGGQRGGRQVHAAQVLPEGN